MNALAPIADFYTPPDTLTRHRFTLDDVIAMRDVSVIHPDTQVELLDGGIMPAEAPLVLTPPGQIKLVVEISTAR